VKAIELKPTLKDLLFGISLANLCYLKVWYLSLTGQARDYHSATPYTIGTFAAAVISVMVLGFAFGFASFGARVLKQRGAPEWLGLLIFLPLIAPLNFFRRFVFNWPMTDILSLGIPLLGIVVCACAALLYRFHQKVIRITVFLIFALWPFCLVTFGTAVLRIGQLSLKPGPSANLSQNAHNPGHPREFRLVWIIFDELDERVAFDSRPAGMRLIEFDRLRAQALVAKDAYPPAKSTIASIPSLTIGKYVQTAVRASPDELLLSFLGETNVVSWSRSSNLFSQAHWDGFRTAVAGWYHPYGRLFGPILDECYALGAPIVNQFDGRSLWTSLASEFVSVVFPLHERTLYMKIHSELLTRALSLVSNRNLDLVFLHFSIPHPPSIYDPGTRKLAVTELRLREGYFNNLLLADQALGLLRSAMELAGVWERTTVLISSDHWWREEDGAYGRIDHRVPFILKLAENSESLTYSPRLNTVLTADLISFLLKNRPRSLLEVAEWLNQHREQRDFRFDSEGRIILSDQSSG